MVSKILFVAWPGMLILEFKSLWGEKFVYWVILSCDDIIEQIFGGCRFFITTYLDMFICNHASITYSFHVLSFPCLQKYTVSFFLFCENHLILTVGNWSQLHVVGVWGVCVSISTINYSPCSRCRQLYPLWLPRWTQNINRF